MFGALAALCCFARVELAYAGCTSTCEGTLGDVTVDPALPCVTVDASLNDCDCAIFVEVDNACAGSLDVRGDELDCAAGDDCFAVAPGEGGAFKLPIRSTGSKRWSLPLNEATSGAHTLDISVSVSKFDDEPGCSVAGAGHHSTGGSWWVGLLWGLCALGRRTRRVRASQSAITAL